MIYSRYPPESEIIDHFELAQHETHDPGAIIAAVVVGCILGAFLLLIFLSWMICLWQARSRDPPDRPESAAAPSTSRKQIGVPIAASCHGGLEPYTIRSYVGCFPKCGGPYKALVKERECRLAPCWFAACLCCCQNLKPHQTFLDEKFTIPVSLLQATATTRRQIGSPIDPLHRVKMSILAPESIVVPVQRERHDRVIEHMESVDFYSYRLQGVTDDKIMY